MSLVVSTGHYQSLAVTTAHCQSLAVTACRLNWSLTVSSGLNLQVDTVSLMPETDNDQSRQAVETLVTARD